jgi:hypothetical protein
MSRKTLTFLFSLLSILGYGVFVFAVGSVPGQDIPFAPGQELNPECAPTDPFCKVSLLPLITHLTGGATVGYEQGNTLLGGLPIKGFANAYSDDGFASILGTITGDFTDVGGAPLSMLVGYQPLGPGGSSTINIGRDNNTDQSNLTIRCQQVIAGYWCNYRIYMLIHQGQVYGFNFNGGVDYYNFPSVLTQLQVKSSDTYLITSSAG